MPPVQHLDSYEACQQDTDALYCSAEFVLVSDKPSSLLDMIKEYSEHQTSHYNHSKLRYGICVTQTCKNFYEKEDEDMALILEACLNETLSKKYDLKVKVIDKYYCETPGEPLRPIDLLDITVATICVIILLANIVGSIRDACIKTSIEDKALRFWLCFSVKRNWKKLMAPVASDGNRHIENLKFFHGIRALNTILVIFGHSIVAAMVAISNSETIEQAYTTFPLNTLLNATLIIQTFLVTSAFLLVYNWQLYSEKHEPTWSMLPKHVIIRWLRLTPTYALTLALTATWFGHLSTGPFWEKYVGQEMYDCRQHWWRHILYINNYYDDSHCMMLTWYLATDIHLYYMAVIVYLACRTARSKIITLTHLFIIGIIIPAVHVYLRDLDGIQMISPEYILALCMNNPYFHTVYKRSHTNLSSYVIGMVVAYLVYDWQQRGVDVNRYQKLPYRLLYWSVMPLSLVLINSGLVFYLDAPRMSVYVRMFTNAAMRPAFSLLIGVLIIGLVFKFEDTYRSILEWRVWPVFSRLSYAAYLTHPIIIKHYNASQTHLHEASIVYGLKVYLYALVVGGVAAFFLWILVEAPVSNLLKEYLRIKTYDQENKENRQGQRISHANRCQRTNKKVE